MKKKEIKGIIFDMDGVLLDNEHLHFRAWQLMFKKIGVNLTYNDFESQIGRTDVATVRHFCKIKKTVCPVKSFCRQKREIYLKLAEKQTKMEPGAASLVKLFAKKYKLALASSEWTDIIKLLLKKVRLRRYFKVIIGKMDVKTRKPSPEIYLKAARKLGLKPEQCAVFEDSVVGVRAAKTAGCSCIAVTNSYSRKKLKRANLVVSSLKDRKRILEFLE